MYANDPVFQRLLAERKKNLEAWKDVKELSVPESPKQSHQTAD